MPPREEQQAQFPDHERIRDVEMVLEVRDGDESAELRAASAQPLHTQRAQRKTHILLHIVRARRDRTLAKLHAKGSSSIIQTPGGEVDRTVRAHSRRVRLRRRAQRLVVHGRSAILGGHMRGMGGLGGDLLVVGLGGGRGGVALVALGGHRGRGGLWDVCGVSGDGVLERGRAVAVCVVVRHRGVVDVEGERERTECKTEPGGGGRGRHVAFPAP